MLVSGVADGRLLGVADLSLTGSDAANRLSGNKGDNLIAGGAGDDLLSGGAGADTLDGGPGRDTASYVEAAAGVFVRLWSGEGLSGEAAGDVADRDRESARLWLRRHAGGRRRRERTFRRRWGGCALGRGWRRCAVGRGGCRSAAGAGRDRHRQLRRGRGRRFRAPLVGGGPLRRSGGRCAGGDREPARLWLRGHAGGRWRSTTSCPAAAGWMRSGPGMATMCCRAARVQICSRGRTGPTPPVTPRPRAAFSCACGRGRASPAKRRAMCWWASRTCAAPPLPIRLSAMVGTTC
jgi:hypothetical protein